MSIRRSSDIRQASIIPQSAIDKLENFAVENGLRKTNIDVSFADESSIDYDSFEELNGANPTVTALIVSVRFELLGDGWYTGLEFGAHQARLYVSADEPQTLPYIYDGFYTLTRSCRAWYSWISSEHFLLYAVFAVVFGLGAGKVTSTLFDEPEYDWLTAVALIGGIMFSTGVLMPTMNRWLFPRVVADLCGQNRIATVAQRQKIVGGIFAAFFVSVAAGLVLTLL